MKSVGIVMLIAVVLSPVAQAELYLEAGIQGGGEVLISTNDADTLNAGGGLNLALGVQNRFGEGGHNGWRLALGYLGDSISAYNGSAEIDTLTFDALYIVRSGPHRIAFGPTVHFSPQYHDQVAGFEPEHIQFDDAVGFALQYGFNLLHGFEIGIRFTQIDYRYAGGSIDAGGLGMYLSNGF